MKNIVFFCLSLTLFSCSSKPTLEQKINSIIQNKKAKVGVAILDLQTGETTQINGNERFPLQSVFKYHVAVKALDEVDKGKWTLDTKVPIKASEILPNTWSPLREERGIKDMEVRVDSLIYLMVSNSDNNACDILLRRIGGPKAVDAYFENLGFKDFDIVYNEEDMQKEWKNQFENYSTPLSLMTILHKFYLREYLSGDMHNFLFAQLNNTVTGKNRIKAGLPPGSKVAHKTGTSSRNEAGISAATNDAGFITLPNGKSYVVVIFVTDSQETDEVNEKIIADITNMVSEN